MNNSPSIKLISHASVIISTSDCKILTDPWFFGKAFNNSWSLYPKSSWDDNYLEEITHIWISHEHPDHFNIPTLKSLPESFKKRVKVIYQRNNSDKIPNAIKGFLGFHNVLLIDNNIFFDLTDETTIMISQIGFVPDSILMVKNGNYTILNVNDCEINVKDCEKLKNKIGNIDVVLNQFSIAGYRGKWNYDQRLKKYAKSILDNIVENHKNLDTEVTIPFASLMYFSDKDNMFINKFTNKLDMVKSRFDEESLRMNVLYPGDTYVLGNNYNSDQAVEKYKVDYKNLVNQEFRVPEIIKLDEIKNNFLKRHKHLIKYFPRWLIKKCQPIKFLVTDINKTVMLSYSDGEFEEIISDKFDISIGSEALNFSFSQTWGISTVAVGGKYLVKNKWEVWKWYKIISSLDNAEFYLKPKFLFSIKNFKYLKSRYSGLLNQIIYKIRRMKT